MNARLGNAGWGKGGNDCRGDRGKARPGWIGLLWLLASTSLAAQGLMPVIRLADRTLTPMEQQSLRVEVRIAGFLAETRVTMAFFNPNARPIEGELVFPLPEGALVAGYALDIGGTMVDGVVVDKEKARVAFETEVRRGVDPGLVEMVRGNNFRTRIYPLPAGKARRVMVRYIAPVSETGAGLRYSFPFRHPEPIAEVSFRIEALKHWDQPVVRESSLSDLTFGEWQEFWVAERSARQVPLARTLVIDLPPLRSRPAVVELAPDGRHYFAIRDTPDMPAAGKAVLPRRVAVIWDASASREDDDHAREREFLRRLVATWKGQPVTVHFQVLRHRIVSQREVTVQGGDSSPLLDEIEKVYYDGGTAIGAIVPLNPAPDFVLLFSDGQGNFGKALPPMGNTPLHTVSAASDADRLILRHLAARSGGRAIDLLAEDPARAAVEVGRPIYSFLRAEYPEGRVREWTPGGATPARRGQVFCGVLAGDKAEITLVYGQPGGPEQRRTVSLTRAEARRSSLVCTWWAAATVDELLVAGSRNEEKVRRLGRDYTLVTPFTSLIVLESLEQYLRHEIAPPVGLPAMRRDYLARQAIAAKNRSEENRTRLEEVLSRWRERVAWWGKDFLAEYGRKKPQQEPQKMVAARQEALSPGMAANEMAAHEEQDSFRGAAGGVAPAAPRAAMSKDKGGDGGRGEGKTAVIALREWTPDTPYLRELKETPPPRQLEVYRHYRSEYGRSPAFFLDLYDFFAGRNPDLAMQVLSNLAEMELENHTLLRILGRKLQQAGQLEWACEAFEEVLRLRPEEPQSFRDLALARADQGRTEEALRLLYRIVTQRWQRFDGIELIALMELNRIVGRTGFRDLERLGIDRRFIRNLGLDLRVVLNWDADATDIDLWVVEPSGETCNYQRKLSAIGGLFTNDFTQGYGPEEYVLRKGLPGRYQIKTDFYGSNAQKMLGAVTLQLEIITGFGRPGEKRRTVTVRLTEKKEKLVIGEVTLP